MNLKVHQTLKPKHNRENINSEPQLEWRSNSLGLEKWECDVCGSFETSSTTD